MSYLEEFHAFLDFGVSVGFYVGLICASEAGFQEFASKLGLGGICSPLEACEHWIAVYAFAVLG